MLFRLERSYCPQLSHENLLMLQQEESRASALVEVHRDSNNLSSVKANVLEPIYTEQSRFIPSHNNQFEGLRLGPVLYHHRSLPQYKYLDFPHVPYSGKFSNGANFRMHLPHVKI